MVNGSSILFHDHDVFYDRRHAEMCSSVREEI